MSEDRAIVSQELEPCPFCGGTPRIVTRDVEPQGDPWYGRKDETFVLCGCGACLFDGDFHEGFYDAETRAVAAWNTRARTAVEAAISKEREACAETAESCARCHPDDAALIAAAIRDRK